MLALQRSKIVDEGFGRIIYILTNERTERMQLDVVADLCIECKGDGGVLLAAQRCGGIRYIK